METMDDKFTPEFKRLKARKPPPNLEDVLDLHVSAACVKDRKETSKSFDNKSMLIKSTAAIKTDLKCLDLVGVKPCSDWTVYELITVPGFYIIPNPFIDGWQSYWVSRCLQDFPADNSNVTNISATDGFCYPKIWQDFVSRSTLEKSDVLRKLRWTTLGYHHDWNSKVYSESKKADFPEDVRLLSSYIAAALGFSDYNAEAAIVNYYHMDSTLAGHVDHSEIDQTAPLISISFGQTAIFLIGGKTKNEQPVALYLRSGDICVMSGPSRLAYHAVPKILPPGSVAEAEQIEQTIFFAENTIQQGGVESTVCSSCNSIPILPREDFKRLDPGKRPADGTDSNVDCIGDKKMKKSELCDKVRTSPPTVDWPSENISGKEDDHVSAGGVINSDFVSRFDSCVDKLNSQIRERILSTDFRPLKTYLASSRINLNIRQVLPAGHKVLPKYENR